jgi:hypothetical protein
MAGVFHTGRSTGRRGSRRRKNDSVVASENMGGARMPASACVGRYFAILLGDSAGGYIGVAAALLVGMDSCNVTGAVVSSAEGLRAVRAWERFHAEMGVLQV